MNMKEIIEKRLKIAKIRESEVDVKQNPRWSAYFTGQIRILETLLNDINSTSPCSTDSSDGLGESFEPNGQVAFINGLPERLERYDLLK